MAERPFIDLSSDTTTRPSTGMRRAMAEAEVGDEQKGEDPTTRALEERVAAMLGQEAAVFLPSGTMANQIALAVHCRPGDEIIAPAMAHITNFEVGGGAAIAGVQNRDVAAVDGIFTAAALAAAIRPPMRHYPRSRLVSIEQTVNLGGGVVWPIDALEEVTGLARSRGLIAHLDGARLLNASVAAGVAPERYGRLFDSSWIDLSKGLGCPVGAVLAGTQAFIDESWRWKQRMGGALRQSGILAAAGLYALDHNVERLAEDHANARRFAEGVAGTPGLRLPSNRIETNIILLDVGEWAARTGRTAADLSADFLTRGVRIGAMSPTLMRAVTHLDVSRDDIDVAIRTVRDALAS